MSVYGIAIPVGLLQCNQKGSKLTSAAREYCPLRPLLQSEHQDQDFLSKFSSSLSGVVVLAEGSGFESCLFCFFFL